MEVMRVAISLNFFFNKLPMCVFEGTRKCFDSNFRYWLTRARMKMPRVRYSQLLLLLRIISVLQRSR